MRAGLARSVPVAADGRPGDGAAMETTPKLSRRDMRHQQQQRRGQGRRQRTDAGEVDAPASGSLVANAREDEPSNEPSEPFGKWSTHFDASVTFTVRGVPLSLHQDPTSDNIGHSVWDVSRAVARFLEVDPWWRRELGRHRRVVELGAGRRPRASKHGHRSRPVSLTAERLGGPACAPTAAAQAVASSALPLRSLAATLR